MTLRALSKGNKDIVTNPYIKPRFGHGVTIILFLKYTAWFNIMI